MSVETVFFAQLIGIYMLFAGLSGLLYPERMKKMMLEFTRSYVLPFFDGALALISGLVIVLLHNNWDTLPATIVTLVGWLALVEGVFFFVGSEKNIQDSMKWAKEVELVKPMSLLALVVGAYLSYVGFLM